MKVAQIPWMRNSSRGRSVCLGAAPMHGVWLGHGCTMQPTASGYGDADPGHLSLLHAHIFTLPTPSAWAVTDEPCQTPAWVSAAAVHGQALAHPCGKAVCISALLLRPDLGASHSTYFSSCTISWLGCTGRSCQDTTD